MTEQELMDLALEKGLPALQDLTDIKENTSELLELYKAELEKMNTEQQTEKLAQEEAIEKFEALPEEQQTGEMLMMTLNGIEPVESTSTQDATVEEEPITEEPPVEEEVVIDYDPLILEQLEILNSHMVVTQELQNESNQIGSETAFLLAITIVFAAAVKVFVDQVTKW